MKKDAKNRLTNAAKRNILTLGSITVVIKIPYKDRWIECSTTQEAVEVLKHLAVEESKKITRQIKPVTLLPEAALEALYGRTETSAWTRESFWQFIENLGDSQKQILGVLARNHKATDEQLRKMLKLDSNQALAGVLSGVSKQAGILNIPARSVYIVEDERRAGELHKTYVAANDFMRIANEMNWPEV